MQPTKEWPYRFPKELMDKARESWQRRSGMALGYDEVEEGLSNLVNLGLVLLEIHRENQAALRPGSGGAGTRPT